MHDDLLAMVTVGHWCCEEALWCRPREIDGDYRDAGRGSELFILLAREFQINALKRRVLMPVLRSYAEKFVYQFNQATDHFTDDEDVLFNDPYIFHEITVEVINKRLNSNQTDSDRMGLKRLQSTCSGNSTESSEIT